MSSRERLVRRRKRGGWPRRQVAPVAPILPVGQISKNLSSPVAKNIPLFRRGQISDKSAHPTRQRGGSRSSRTVRWDAMDAAASGGFTPAGRNVRSVRRSRVVLAPRPWRQVGGFHLPATVAKEAAHREEHV